MLPNDFSLPKELQWLETIGTSSTLEGDVLADRIADIHSTHYSSESINSARRLWTRVGARSTHVGDRYKELLDAIYIKHTIVTTSLICYYCKRNNPQELTCQDLERFFQTISDVLSLTITDNMLPISDSHVRLLLQHLLSNDETRLTFFDFIFDCNTHEEGVTQVSFDNTCRVLLVFFPRHKLLSNLLEYFKNNGTTTISKYLWPMIFNFLSTYSNIDAISNNYNFSSSIYPLAIDKFCRHVVSLAGTDEMSSISQKSGALNALNRTDSTKRCLDDIDSVLIHHQDTIRSDLTPQSESLIRTPNTTKRVQFAGVKDDSLLEHPSPPKINITPSRITTPHTQAKRDRPPSALSQKQTELAARLAAFKASSQRRLSTSGIATSSKQANTTDNDTSNVSSPHGISQQIQSPCSDFINKQHTSQPNRAITNESLREVDASNSRANNTHTNTTVPEVVIKSNEGVSQDRLARTRSLAANPYNYISPTAEIIMEARKAIAAHQSAKERDCSKQLKKEPMGETIQPSTGPCIATPSISSCNYREDHLNQVSKLAASAMTTPLIAEQAFNNTAHTPLQHPKSRPLVSDVAAKYASRKSSFRSDCITVQPVQYQSTHAATAPVISLTPSIGTSSSHGGRATSGMRQLSATAAKYINAQMNQANKSDQ